MHLPANRRPSQPELRLGVTVTVMVSQLPVLVLVWFGVSQLLRLFRFGVAKTPELVKENSGWVCIAGHGCAHVLRRGTLDVRLRVLAFSESAARASAVRLRVTARSRPDHPARLWPAAFPQAPSHPTLLCLGSLGPLLWLYTHTHTQTQWLFGTRTHSTVTAHTTPQLGIFRSPKKLFFRFQRG